MCFEFLGSFVSGTDVKFSGFGYVFYSGFFVIFGVVIILILI